jgi:hypothetical protein
MKELTRTGNLPYLFLLIHFPNSFHEKLDKQDEMKFWWFTVRKHEQKITSPDLKEMLASRKTMISYPTTCG